MPRKGCDYAWGRPTVASLKAGGYTFACRYLAPLPNGKCLDRAEADRLQAGGIDVVSNWEHYGDWTHDYSGGAATGRAHALEADRQHKACGGPSSRPIYFSTDFDPTDAQMATIADYYRGVASVIGLSRTGAYGGYRTIKYLFDQGVITWGWQTYAWSGGRWDSRAQLRQVQNGVLIGGVDSDVDMAVVDDFGQWSGSGGVVQQDFWELYTAVSTGKTPAGYVPAGHPSTNKNIVDQASEASHYSLKALADKLDQLIAALQAAGGGATGTPDVGGVAPDVEGALRSVLPDVRLTFDQPPT